MAAADFFFLSERTNFLFFIQISNKFRENPSSPSAVRVVVDTKYNTHTHSINNTTTTTTTCRTTKVAVPLLMSTSTTIYSPVQTCVLFNVIVSRVNSRFCSCCVCWYFLWDNNEPAAAASSSSLTLLLLMQNNLKHTVRCCHQVQDCCRLREWYVFIKLFFFLLVFVSWGGPIRNTFQPPFSDEERKQYSA